MERSTSKFKLGDHVKVEFSNDQCGYRERMWIRVERVDHNGRLLFGRLDNQLIVSPTLTLGDMLAVDFSKVLDHRTFGEPGSSGTGHEYGSAEL